MHNLMQCVEGAGVRIDSLILEPLASASAESVARAVGPTIQRYLTGDIGADQGAR